MKCRAQEAISGRHRPQTVAMAQTEHLAANLHQSRLHQTLHSELLEIAVCPHVVVSLEEIHAHSPVYQIRNSTEHSDISLRNHITILIPEIPYVTQKIQRFRILGKRPEEFNETRLPGSRITDLQTEMHIRYEICEFPVHLSEDKDCRCCKETI